MSRRQKPHLRCPDCRMHRSLCICSLLPRIETRTRVVLIVHQLEAVKPTNTGLVAARCLPSSTVVYRGRAPQGAAGGATPDPFAAVAADAAGAAGAQRLMLFPHPSATPLERWRGRSEPVVLVVPDGTWPQAIRMHTRLVARAGDIPCVSLPASGDGRRLRAAALPHRLATLEAVALALGILEGPEVEAALLRVYRIMTERTMWTNGRIAAADVTGGIPPGVRSHDPLFVPPLPRLPP